MSRWLFEISFAAATVGLLVAPIGIANTGGMPAPPTEDNSVRFERVITRTSEVGLIAFIALWLLRVIISDLRADIRKVNELLMEIAMLSQKAGGELSADIREANQKLDDLIRSNDRLERSKGSKIE